jgi:hypothetical protein
LILGLWRINLRACDVPSLHTLNTHGLLRQHACLGTERGQTAQMIRLKSWIWRLRPKESNGRPSSKFNIGRGLNLHEP